MNRTLPVVIIYLILSNPVFAWNDVVTHPILSDIAIHNSSLCEAMNVLWMNECTKYEIFDETYTIDREVLSWVRLGAELEDSSVRSLNHFHDALISSPWSYAGLNIGSSAILWSQDKAVADNEWSWGDTQNKYWSALIATSSELRDEKFSQMFRGLGHQMHLLQDMAVPAHVRMDMHLADALSLNETDQDKYFETWVKELDLSEIGFQYVDGVWFSQSSISPTVIKTPIDGFSPIVNYFDADVYDGNSASGTTLQGLAEYSSSNFFSTDTVFSIDFNRELGTIRPFPRPESTNLQKLIDGMAPPIAVYGEDNIPFVAKYLKKNADGEQIEHFARAGYLESEYTDEEKIFYQDEYLLSFYLDGKCHEDYARKLLPRAVGYSTAMLDYFFRARGNAAGVEILDEDGDVVGMDVRLTNMTEGEALVDPILAVSGRYHLNSDDWEFSATMQKRIDSVLRDEDDVVACELLFESILDLPADDDPNFSDGGSSVVLGKSIPMSATEKEYFLAFKGELGGEPEAVGAASLELGWSEDWNQELASNHPWYVSPDATGVEAEFWSVEDSRLLLSNVRSVGEVVEQVNEIVLDANSIASADGVAGVEFPFEVQPETVLAIDVEPYVMTTGLPLDDCATSVSRQEIIFEFDTVQPLHVLLPGSTKVYGLSVGWEEGRWAITLGKSLQQLDFLSDEKRVNITGIRVRQELGELCAPAEEEQVQELALDYIRVF